MPAGADTVALQEGSRARGPAVDHPAGPQARRQPAPRRRGRSCGRDGAPARHETAAAGDRACRRARAAPRSRCSSRCGWPSSPPATSWWSRAPARARRRLRRQPADPAGVAATPAGRGHRSRHRRATSQAGARHARARGRATIRSCSPPAARRAATRIMSSATVAARGRLDFWQIAMKPGRPLAFGRLGEAVFVGLPGNPVAAMVCFLLFARPVLLRLGGFAWPAPRRCRCRPHSA